MPPLTPGEGHPPIAAPGHQRERAEGREGVVGFRFALAATSRPSDLLLPSRRPGGMATVPKDVQEGP